MVTWRIRFLVLSTRILILVLVLNNKNWYSPTDVVSWYLQELLPQGFDIVLDEVIFHLSQQAGCLLEPWGWSQEDRLLHVLPLHHTHGRCCFADHLDAHINLIIIVKN